MNFQDNKQNAIMQLLRRREISEAVGVEMDREAKRFAALADSEPVRVVSSFNLFQTPVDIAAGMVDQLTKHFGSLSGLRGLEPSAGLGRLINAANATVADLAPIDWTIVEQSTECADELYRLSESFGGKLIQDDFLECDLDRLGGLFDFALMNPPFKMGRDVKHIAHARQFIRPGGLLVSLCYDGARQNKKLRPTVDTWNTLPPGSFKSEGTGAGAAMVTIEADSLGDAT